MTESLFCNRFRALRIRRMCCTLGHKWRGSFDVQVCRRCGSMRQTPGWDSGGTGSRWFVEDSTTTTAERSLPSPDLSRVVVEGE